jgi:TPR repeat protein
MHMTTSIKSLFLGLALLAGCSAAPAAISTDARTRGDFADRLAAGDGVTRDATHAAALYQRACDDGDLRSCNNLAGLYLDGAGVPRDGARASTLYRHACDGGFSTACSNLVARDGAPVAVSAHHALSDASL